MNEPGLVLFIPQNAVALCADCFGSFYLPGRSTCPGCGSSSWLPGQGRPPAHASDESERASVEALAGGFMEGEHS
jgi:hypothetical protein